MKKSRIILLYSGTFLLGIIVGIVAAGLIWLHFVRFSIGNTFKAMTVTEEVQELQSIREGHPNDAADLLELRLNSDIFFLDAELRKVPPSRRDPSLVSALQQARNYRLIYPYKADSPEDKALIQQAFQLVGGQTNH